MAGIYLFEVDLKTPDMGLKEAMDGCHVLEAVQDWVVGRGVKQFACRTAADVYDNFNSNN